MADEYGLNASNDVVKCCDAFSNVLYIYLDRSNLAPTCDSSRRSGFGTLARIQGLSIGLPRGGDARPAQQGQLPSTSGLVRTHPNNIVFNY